MHNLQRDFGEIWPLGRDTPFWIRIGIMINKSNIALSYIGL